MRSRRTKWDVEKSNGGAPDLKEPYQAFVPLLALGLKVKLGKDILPFGIKA